jgi:endonuclease/exonuclease/phosphatase (EEP) superfamily protein YafD
MAGASRGRLWRPPASLSRHAWPPSARLGGWSVTLPLAGLAAARLIGFDRSGLLSVANASTPFVYLPAYGGLLAGLRERRHGLTAVAAGVAACHLVWTAPELRPRRRLPDGVRGAPRLRVVSANVRFTSPHSGVLARELAESGADLLFIQELSWAKLRELTSAGAFVAHPYSFADPRAPGSFGGGIWSRHPLTEAESRSLAGLPQARATVHVHGREIRLFNVHIKAPSRRRWVDLWRRQFSALAEAVVGEKRPLIVAGDFNATYGHEPFRRLLATGLRDAHVEAGKGLAASWPRGRLVPPFWRLDHVLVSPDLGVVDAWVGNGRGSDHRPVGAELAVVVPAPGASAAEASRRRRS